MCIKLKINANKLFVTWMAISLLGTAANFSKAENKAIKWPSHIQVVLDATKPLKYDRGRRLPLYLWQAMDPGQRDVVHLAIPPSDNGKRNELILDLVGIDKGKPSFKREKEDRY